MPLPPPLRAWLSAHAPDIEVAIYRDRTGFLLRSPATPGLRLHWHTPALEEDQAFCQVRLESPDQPGTTWTTSIARDNSMALQLTIALDFAKEALTDPTMPAEEREQLLMEYASLPASAYYDIDQALRAEMQAYYEALDTQATLTQALPEAPRARGLRF